MILWGCVHVSTSVRPEHAFEVNILIIRPYHPLVHSAEQPTNMPAEVLLDEMKAAHEIWEHS